MVSCSVYLRDVANVLREQISESLDEEFVHTSDMSQNFSLVVNAENGTIAWPAIERFIKCSKDISLSWKTAESYKIESSVGCFQVFSEKPQVSLSAGALQLYLLHVTILDFSEEPLRKLISSGRPVVMYLPVKLEVKNRGPSHKRLMDARSGRLSKADRLRALHASTERCLKPLLIVAQPGNALSTKKIENAITSSSGFVCCRPPRNRRFVRSKARIPDV